MGNCLKTQLKEVVNNDNLKYFDAIIIKYKTTNSDRFFNTGLYQVPGITPSSITVEILSNNGYLSNSLKTVNYGTKYTYTDFVRGVWICADQTNQEVVVKVSSKTDFKGVNATNSGVSVEYNVRDFDYSGFSSLVDTQNAINLSDLIGLHINSFSYIQSSTIVGTMGELAYFNNLTDCVLNSWSFKGDILDFVANKRSQQITSGSLDSLLITSAVEFNEKKTTPGIIYKLMWDANSIIMYKIDGNSNIAYTYNASAAGTEISNLISSLTSQGYTITAVD